MLRDIYHYNYPFDISRPEEYARSLESIANSTGSIVFTLQLKKTEYDRESEKFSHKPMTRESFYDILAVLFEHFHGQVDVKKTTVTEFVSYKKRYEGQMIAIRKATERDKVASHNLRNV